MGLWCDLYQTDSTVPSTQNNLLKVKLNSVVNSEWGPPAPGGPLHRHNTSLPLPTGSPGSLPSPWSDGGHVGCRST